MITRNRPKGFGKGARNSIKMGYNPTYNRPADICTEPACAECREREEEIFKAHILKREWTAWTGYDDLDLLLDAEAAADPLVASIVKSWRVE